MRKVPILSVLLLFMAGAALAQNYSRDDYGGWIDADGDCQNTRQELLIARSLMPVELDGRGCRVLSGLWVDFYSGSFVQDATALDIDHVVALAEAHRSGGAAWNNSAKRKFANDQENLVITARQINQEKSDFDPANWMPPRPSQACSYLDKWAYIKAKWQLYMDAEEAEFIKSKRQACP